MRSGDQARWVAVVVALCLGCTGELPSQCVPAMDRCNGLDDDCDGQVDEGFGVGDACTVGLGACRVTGHLVCATDGLSAACDEVARPPSEEICNGVDDDCDGEVDEGLVGCCAPGEVRACGAAVDVGVCRAGHETCGPDFAWPGRCLDADGAAVVLPGARPETCNGVDDDCDGVVDQGFDAGQPCSAGVGACFAAGHMTCTADGLATACDVEAGAPAAETCNGVDDDCDGVVDEDDAEGCTPRWLDRDGDGAGTGSPRCTCAAAAGWTGTVGGDCDDANPAVRPGIPERCNGVDDDCDGAVDQGFDVGGWCAVGVGSCQRWAQRICSPDGAAALCPAVAGAPAAETCNDLDDDCDGAADEHPVPELCGSVPPGHHAQPEVLSCTQRQCVLACDAGWSNMDWQVANGCECQPDADDLAGLGNDCHAPIGLGSLVPGQQLEHLGTIVPADDADHFVFTSSAAGAGTSPWPNSPGEFGWWICVRLDPAVRSRVGLSMTGTGGTPIPVCTPTSNWGGGGCFNNPNGQVRTYNIRIDRPWNVPAACTLDAATDTAAYRLQVKGYAAEPVYPYPW